MAWKRKKKNKKRKKEKGRKEVEIGKKEQRGQRRKQEKEEEEKEKEEGEQGNDKLLIGERGRKEGRGTWINETKGGKSMAMKQTNAKVFLFSQTLK